MRQDTRDGRLDSRPRPLLRRAANDRAARPRGRRARACSGLVGPSGCGKSTLLELICGLQRAERRDDRGRRRPRAPPGGSPAAPTCPSATCCCPGTRRIDNAALALRNRGLGRAAAARQQAAALFERFGLAGFEARGAGRALRRDAPAGRLPAHAASPASRCWRSTSPSPRSTRSPGRRCRSGWRRRCGADPRTVVLVTHDVEEALYLCDRVVVLSARPARIVAELRAPPRARADRDAAVTDPAFVASPRAGAARPARAGPA